MANDVLPNQIANGQPHDAAKILANENFLNNKFDDSSGHDHSGSGKGAPVTQKSRLLLTDADFTIPSTIFADVTSATITIVTKANPVLIIVAGWWDNNTAGQTNSIDIDIDGVRQGGNFGLVSYTANAGYASNLSFNYLSAVLTAASHTFKLQAKRDAGIGTIKKSATAPLHFAVIEFKG